MAAVGFHATETSVPPLVVARAGTKHIAGLDEHATQERGVFGDLAKITGTAGHGIVDVEAADSGLAGNLFFHDDRPEVVDLALEVTPHADIEGGDEALDRVVAGLAGHGHDDPQGFGGEAAHERNLGEPVVRSGCAPVHRAGIAVVSKGAIARRHALKAPAMAAHLEGKGAQVFARHHASRRGVPLFTEIDIPELAGGNEFETEWCVRVRRRCVGVDDVAGLVGREHLADVAPCDPFVPVLDRGVVLCF